MECKLVSKQIELITTFNCVISTVGESADTGVVFVEFTDTGVVSVESADTGVVFVVILQILG